jgi:rod shape-determining protein MreC
LQLPSKIKSKYIVVIALALFFIVFPLNNFIKDFFVAFCRKLLITPPLYEQKLSELQRKNLALTLRLGELQYLRTENEKLRKALGLKEEKELSFVGAEIVAFDPSSWRRTVIVNVGKDRNITEGAYAIDEKGYLVGKIVEVKKTYSRLMLINDPDFSLPVFVGDSGFGMLHGALEGLKILYIESGEDIKIKDKVWLKINSTSFPIYIGVVKRLTKNADSLFWDIEAELLADTNFLDKVFIVIG